MEKKSLLKWVICLVLGVASVGCTQVYAQESSGCPEPLLPKHEESAVLSIYSSAFSKNAQTKKPVSGSYVVTSAGKNIIKSGEDSRIRLDHASVDVSGMTHLHFDVYSESQNQCLFDIRDGGYHMFSKTYIGDISIGEWNSVDVPLNEIPVAEDPGSQFDVKNVIRFTAGTRHTNFQGVYYFDNIYYYKENTGGETTGMCSLENSICKIVAFSDNLNLCSQEAIGSISIYNLQGGLLREVDAKFAKIIDVDVSDLSLGYYVLRVDFSNGRRENRMVWVSH